MLQGSEARWATGYYRFPEQSTNTPRLLVFPAEPFSVDALPQVFRKARPGGVVFSERLSAAVAPGGAPALEGAIRGRVRLPGYFLFPSDLAKALRHMRDCGRMHRTLSQMWSHASSHTSTTPEPARRPRTVYALITLLACLYAAVWLPSVRRIYPIFSDDLYVSVANSLANLNEPKSFNFYRNVNQSYVYFFSFPAMKLGGSLGVSPVLESNLFHEYVPPSESILHELGRARFLSVWLILWHAVLLGLWGILFYKVTEDGVVSVLAM